MIMWDCSLGPSRDIGLISFHSIRRQAQTYRNILYPLCGHTKIAFFGHFWPWFPQSYCLQEYQWVLPLFIWAYFKYFSWTPKMVIYPLAVEWVKRFHLNSHTRAWNFLNRLQNSSSSSSSSTYTCPGSMWKWLRKVLQLINDVSLTCTFTIL